MGTLQTELEKTLAEWSKEEMRNTTHLAEVLTLEVNKKPVISRELFNYVRDNPNQYQPNVINVFTQQGFKYKTVSSLLYQMQRAGLMTRDKNGRVSVIVDEYDNKFASKLRKASKQENPAPKTHKQSPQPSASPAIMLSSARDLTADYVMQAISIAEGKKLFTLLSQVF